jgi:hypothetical protein
METTNPDDRDYKKNLPMLRDVYNLVIFLEAHEHNLRKTKQEMQKMLLQDPFRPKIMTQSLARSLRLDSTGAMSRQGNDDALSATSAGGTLSQYSLSTLTTYSSRRSVVKDIMCPLG